MEERSIGRWTLIRDVTVFQLRLTLDGLRDFALIPVSLIAGVADLVLGGTRFYSVLEAGRRSEEWIRLFAELERVEPADAEGADRNAVDAMIERVERVLVEQYERGGVTASAKSAIDRGLDAIARREG
jgi:hypothetical protein